MSDKNSLRNAIIIIGGSLGIIWTFIQINKETKLVPNIVSVWNGMVNWYLTTKIPLTWITLLLIIYFVLKYLTSNNEVGDISLYGPNSILDTLLRNREHYRYAIKLCERGKTINELKSFWNRKYTGGFEEMLEELEEYGGLFYDEEELLWISSEDALNLLNKYGHE